MATILVVDDHAVNREFLATLLGYRQHRVIEAADGQAALELARTDKPDLVISDILMPSGDGFELVLGLRQEPMLAEVPVIFYTAHYNEREAVNLAKSCGVRCVLTKPSAPEMVLKIVDEVLAESPEGRQAATVPAGFGESHLRLVSQKLAKTAEELDWTTSRLMALIEMNLQLAAEREPLQMAQVFCRWTRDLVAARQAIVGLWESGSSARGVVVISGLAQQGAYDLERGLRQWSPYPAPLGADGKSRRFDASVPAHTLGLPSAHPDVSSILVVPVQSSTRQFGWVCVTEKIGRSCFNADDERLLTIFAAQLGRSFENYVLMKEIGARTSELEVEVRRRTASQWRVEIQYAVAHVLAETSTIQEAAPDLLKMICSMAGYHAGWLLEVEANGTELRLLDVWHENAGTAAKMREIGRRRRLRRGEGVGGRTLAAGATSWFPNVAADPGLLWVNDVPGLPASNAVGIPVITRGAVTGVLVLLEGSATPPDAELIDLFRALGSQVGQFVERRAQEQRILRLARIQAVLTGINGLIVRVADRESLFKGVCRIAIDEGEFTRAEIITLDSAALPPDPHLRVVAMRSRQPLSDETSFSPNRSSSAARAIGDALAKGITGIDNDLKDDIKRQQSLVAMPLSERGGVCAALVLYASAVNFFTDDEMLLLKQLVADISFALDTLSNRAQLTRNVYFDPVTGLPNRALFAERLSQGLNLARQDAHSLVVVAANLRSFGSINAMFGRLAGDEVLRELSRRLQAVSRYPDHLARISGHSFATFLPDIQSAVEPARRLELALSEALATPIRVGNDEINLSMQVGVAVFPSDGNDADSLLAAAETALTRARATGAKLSFFEPAMHQEVALRMDIEARLKRALPGEEFVLHYQPKVNLATRALVGFEALIRWQDPQRGMVPPMQFIPTLEETGMIGAVGLWAVRRALRDQKAWRDAGLDAPRIAVNVSVVQFREPTFVDNILGILAEFQAAYGDHGGPSLELEVTESAAMNDIGRAIGDLQTLRDAGITVSIDDFGTGHSSLGYLARLPVTTLKIDRSFVATMEAMPSSRTIVEAIISLSHSLDLEVIAEGVETEPQAAMLLGFGCDQLQGYLVSRPVPADQAASFIKAKAA